MNTNFVDLYEVRESFGKGKGLFAKNNFDVGNVIMEEAPLVSCQFAWNVAYGYSACHHCMRSLETAEQNVRRLTNNPSFVFPGETPYLLGVTGPVSCDDCPVLYCSLNCKELANDQYHRTICCNPTDMSHPVNVLVEAWKQIHYPPETTSIMLIVRLLASIRQTNNPPALIEIIKKFFQRTTNEDSTLVHKLLGDQFVEQISMLRELVAKVISGDDVDQFLMPDGFLSLLALIGTNGQGIGTSPLAEWLNLVTNEKASFGDKAGFDDAVNQIYDEIEEHVGPFINTEGSGLFINQSAANHSCLPNAEVSFPYNDHRLRMTAIRPIKEGEEITISYLDQCSLTRSRHSRQKELALNYLFRCSCERCQEEQSEPDCTSEEEMSDESD